MEPGFIGRLRTRNRIIKTASGTGFVDNGLPCEQMNDFYASLAKGGVGLIIVENCSVDWPRGTHFVKSGLRFYNDQCIPSHRRLTEAVHKHHCPIFIQFMHSGPWYAKQGGGSPEGRVAVSALSQEELPSDAWIPSKELSIAEIEELIDIFARAAVNARAAGYDGVEINGSYYHLINGFLSRFWNRRQDAYGCGSFENRTRFYCEVIREIKKRCGADYPVATNINAVEYGLKNGLTLEESVEFPQFLQQAGADLIQVRVAGYGEYGSLLLPDHLVYPEVPKHLSTAGMDVSRKGAGIQVPFAAAIKARTSVPVCASGRLNPELGEDLLRQGKVDFIGMARRLVADPELPVKVAAGRLQDIAPCAGCGYCAESRMGDRPLKCRINAAVGKERDYEIKPAEKRKKVLIVGGGLAGMEAARVAALRGHDVILCEKERYLGGLLNLASLVKDFESESLLDMVRYFETQLGKLGVTVRLGKEVDASTVKEIKPDVVILAAGGLNNVPAIRGIDHRKVVNSSRLHSTLKKAMRFLGPKKLEKVTKAWMPIGRRVLILGGAIAGCQLAEFLVKRGRKVTVVDTAEALGEGLPYDIPFRLFRWLTEKGVVMKPGVRYEEVTDQGLVITTKEGKRETLEADTIITTSNLLPNQEILRSLEGNVAEVYPIGDCRQFGLMHDAIADGSRIARSL